jgi:hypothetical protein
VCESLVTLWQRRESAIERDVKRDASPHGSEDAECSAT